MPTSNHLRSTDVPGVAEYLATSERHIRRLVERREIPFFRLGRKLRFDLDLIDSWIDTHRVPVGGVR